MKTVLIVDDAAFMRMFVKNVIEKTGDYKVIGEAVDGNDAIEKYKMLKPDLVTLDITMPNLDGLGALKGIMSVNPDARVVMCSAMGQKVMVMDALKLGARDFVVKPFEASRVLEALSKAGR